MALNNTGLPTWWLPRPPPSSQLGVVSLRVHLRCTASIVEAIQGWPLQWEHFVGGRRCMCPHYGHQQLNQAHGWPS